MLRRIAHSGAIVLVSLAGSVANAQDSDLVAAAEAEGKLVWYTTVNVRQFVRPMVEAFENRYKITVEFVSGGSRDVATRLTNEAQAGKVYGDVWDGSTAFSTLGPAGLAEPYKVAAWADFPEALKDKEGRWTAQYIQVITAAVNTDLVPAADIPKTYEDLLDPKWKGKMAWNADGGPTSPEGFIGNILISMGEEKGMGYLRKLADQDVANVAANQRAILDQTINGEYAISILTENHHASISAAKGAPVKWVPIEPAIMSFSRVGIVKGAPHPNAAKLFLEFLLSEEGQAIYREADYLPANPKVAAKEPGLRPGAGGFTANVISLETYTENKEKWAGIYKELFE
ncbi:ABC transporter substrate-binding protein [Sinorhizobium mexicanum]|uniref:Extracellular solute-binding protein n=1 Tax=Sinorhizobium mexicanum TaxID=375549 RepID=A0A859R290_9HYPH|nr:extracellular solute-binding protein [Sinorhizobium mexicanum]MBP1888100.1 iron(III) transport system substrate-binding protein [Sinorhizobium mexicanum]QLL65709.1 extracellular solute-binding protein [Sinorhizobium mexicanum]